MKASICSCVRFFFFFPVMAMTTGPVCGQAETVPQETDYYRITKMAVPDHVVLEAGGLAFNDKGQLAVPTRRGDVWLITNPGSSHPSFERFAQGLHEPLGIAYRDNAYYVTQRGELTKIEDTNRNGRADRYRTIYRWPLTGNYHEYSYGPKFLPDGDMLVTLNLSWIGRGASLTDWRGWMLRITEEGEMTPVATGLRSPLGFGLNAGGDIFYSENQGDWIATGRVTHLKEGDFGGHPEGLQWAHRPESPVDLRMEDIDESLGLSLYEYARKIPALKAPSTILPHGIMGISTSDLLLIENDDQVGPFAGQLLVGDQGHSRIMRIFHEKVDGEYQGAVFGFRQGFSSGVIKLAWGPEDDIYVGMTSRGWSATGEESYGIDRLSWNGVVPFEMQAVNAEPDGFTIHFTQAADPGRASDPDSYAITDFTYKYHSSYGSPVIGQMNKAITRIALAADHRSVRLYVDGLREGYVNEIKAEGVRSREGDGLLHPEAYYTLNNIPEDRAPMATSRGPVENVSANLAGEEPSKSATAMPAEWTRGADQTIVLGTEPGLRFDQTVISVKAGSRIAFSFSNDDDMLHNAVIVKPGTAGGVGTKAMQLGLNGHDMGYVPVMEDVLYHTSLLGPQEEETIYFVAPDSPGDYQFVCTFPGHHLTMRGILRVE
ncbi:MAG: plastocyanin/azurin family copper-binding protein [Balneolales bacterium]